MASAEHKSFNAPDETRSFERGKVELLNIGGASIGRLVLEPGWRWSEHVKPIAGTEWCEAPHFQYQVSGRLHDRLQHHRQRQIPGHHLGGPQQPRNRPWVPSTSCAHCTTCPNS